MSVSSTRSTTSIPSLDTPPEVERTRVEGLRQTPALRDGADGEDLLAGLRQHYPRKTPTPWQQRLADRFPGPELADPRQERVNHGREGGRKLPLEIHYPGNQKKPSAMIR